MLETPLIRCAHNGHFETVQFLVEHGADVNSIDLVCYQHLFYFRVHHVGASLTIQMLAFAQADDKHCLACRSQD